MRPLENCIRYSFIPAITNGHICNDEERLILTQPPRLRGLGIPNPFTKWPRGVVVSVITSHVRGAGFDSWLG